MSKVAHISSLQKRTNSLLSNERIHELGSCLIIYDLHFLEIDFAFGFFQSICVIMAWKASVKKEKETRWFSRKFCVCEARKGPNPTPFIADDSWPLFVLSVRGNPKWGTSRDQWNSALNYLIYWSSSKTLKTICASEAPKLLAPIYAQNKNTTILSQEKLPHLYPVLSTKYYRLFQMSAVLIS